MYLSRVEIDKKKYETMKALYNLEIMHGMVERSFEGSRQRNLWRMDQLAGKDYLLLLSSTSPNNDNLPEQIGFADSKWETKSYDSFLSKISNGSQWHFRLTVNPTVCTYQDSNVRGKVKAIVTVPAQKEWLKKQGEKRGFSLLDNQFDVVETDWKKIKKDKREVRIISVSFEGILTVTDVDSFRELLTCGIGREKAYGMGLMTIVPYD
ncbi:MAG: type I-E CRISPR-associated protein Cas6/Cse3/CasE [Bacillota bacterium]|nr:type I-E CRISPR-associated protein Cas6/Cse3/CasE [Bacillota bacterium]